MADGESERSSSPGRTPGGGWVPVPDPTTLTTEAVERATGVFRREIQSLRETIETRLDAADADRTRLWERLRDLPAEREAAMGHLRDELIQRDAQDREVITQRLNDLDAAAKVAAGHIEKIPVDLTGDFHKALRAEREYILSQIENARAETQRTGDVSQEKFAAVDALFASNALALAAALAAQEKAVAAQNDSNTLAISKSESSTKETIAANAAQAQTGLTSLSDQVTDLKERVVRIESTGVGVSSARTERRLDIGQVVAVVAVIVAVLSVVLYALKKLPVLLPRTPAALASRGAAMGYCNRCGAYAALDQAAMCGTCRRGWQPTERPGDLGYHAAALKREPEGPG
jgi:hypothetical protein